MVSHVPVTCEFRRISHLNTWENFACERDGIEVFVFACENVKKTFDLFKQFGIKSNFNN